MLSIQKDVSLKNFSNYKIGGRAKYFLEVSSLLELKEGFAKWNKISETLPTLPRQGGVFILGAGTNVLIGDKGFDGLVIHNNIKDIKILRYKDIKRTKEELPNILVSRYPDIYLWVGAGVLMEDLLAFCIKNSLSGFEWAGGLPGTLGGAIRGNAGAFRGEIKDNIVEVTSFDIKTQQVKKRSLKNCKFEYRGSVFKRREGEVIISAVLKLKKGDKRDIENQIKEKIEYRRERHPLEFPNIGSIFKNIPVFAKASAGRSSEKVPQELLKQLKGSIKNDPFPVLPAAKLLAKAGLKGEKQGEAMVSWKHPNFIVNLGNATSEDVLKLISRIKNTIKNKYGIELEEEISILK